MMNVLINSGASFHNVYIYQLMLYSFNILRLYVKTEKMG